MNLFLIRGLLLFTLQTLFQLALFAQPPIILGAGNVKSVQSSIQTIFYSPVLVQDKGDVAATLCYSNSYLLKDFSTSYGAVGYGTALGTFNAGYERFGNEYLNLNRVVAGYGQVWGPLQLGFSFNYLVFNSVTANSGMVYSQSGVKFQPTKEMLLSFSASNIEQSELAIEETKLPIPTIFLMGYRWRESKNLALFAECEKDLQHPLVVKLGGELNLNQPFGLRLGVFKHEVLIPTLGFWFLHKQFQLDVGYLYDNRLGSSCSLSITYSTL